MPTMLYLTPHDHGRPLTLEEFEHSRGQEGYRYELIEGRLQVSPLPDLPHDCLSSWLAQKLRTYMAEHPEVVNQLRGPARVFVPGRRGTTAPEPDLAVYRDFPLHVPIAQRRWQDAHPFIVVEILSADTAEKDLERNLTLYLRVPSVREYWILDPRVDPDHPSLTVHRRRGRRWQNPIEVAAGETYITRLLPHFRLVLDPSQ